MLVAFLGRAWSKYICLTIANLRRSTALHRLDAKARESVAQRFQESVAQIFLGHSGTSDTDHDVRTSLDQWLNAGPSLGQECPVVIKLSVPVILVHSAVWLSRTTEKP